LHPQPFLSARFTLVTGHRMLATGTLALNQGALVRVSKFRICFL
jgi:hypothetical protein